MTMNHNTEEINYTHTPNNVTFDQDEHSSSQRNAPDKKEISKRIPASEVNENDVLCGRGAGTNRHVGNKRFRELVSVYQEAYLSAKILEKSVIAEKIVYVIKSRTPAGRFLKDTTVGKNDAMWCEISDRAAKEKTSQALRERAPELRRTAQQQYAEGITQSPFLDRRGIASLQSSPIQMPILASPYVAPSNAPDTPKTQSDAPSTIEINDNDVLCGRGGITNCHIGNRRFRELVKSYQPIYLAVPKREKADIARRLVSIIRNADPPGRFLQKDGEKGRWYDIGEKAREKTSQALREKAPEVRSLYSAAASLVDTKSEALRPEYSRHTNCMPSMEEYLEHPTYQHPDHVCAYFSPMRTSTSHPRSSYSEPKITRINDNDIILGRSVDAIHHVGNIRFRDLVKSRLSDYLKAAKQEKSSIARAIVEAVRNSNPSGRFLAEDSNNAGVFTDVGDARAMEKTSQALRDCPCPSSANVNGESMESNQTQDAVSNATAAAIKQGGLGLGEVVSDINDSDVLLGRGAGVNVHIGNRRFRQLVNHYRSAYQNAAKLEKASIARTIVDIIRTSTPQGRFLSKDPERPGAWVEVSDDRAREKASQALREQVLEDSNTKRQHSQVGDSPSTHSVLSERNEGSAYNARYNQYSNSREELHSHRYFPYEPEKFHQFPDLMHRDHSTMLLGNSFLPTPNGVRLDGDSPISKKCRLHG